MTDDASDEPLEVVSDASKAAQEIQKGFFLNELLGPAAKVIGQRWAQNLTNYYSKKDRENLEAHVNQATPMLPKPEDVVVSPSLVGELLDWTDFARRVDPITETELAAVVNDHDRLSQLGTELAAVNAELETAEESWLSLAEEMEQK